MGEMETVSIDTPLLIVFSSFAEGLIETKMQLRSVVETPIMWEKQVEKAFVHCWAEGNLRIVLMIYK